MRGAMRGIARCALALSFLAIAPTATAGCPSLADLTGGLDAGQTPDASDEGPDAGDAAAARCDPTSPFGTPRELVELSSPALTVAAAARLSPDELTVYYEQADSIFSGTWKLFSATRAGVDEAFTNVTELAGLDGDGGINENPSPSGNGLALYYDHTVLSDGGVAGVHTLLVAQRANTGVPFVLPQQVRSSPDADQAFVLPDSSALYFVDLQPGKGITRAPLSNGYVGPGALVGGIPPGAYTPVVRPDELAIYFQLRNRIWTAERSDTSAAFANPRAAGIAPPNSGDVDDPDWVSSDDCHLYFDRAQPGKVSIYFVSR